MALPLKVNIRGLFVRRAATALTIGGIGLIVMVFVIVWGMTEGLQRVFRIEASEKNLLVVRKGSNAETTSGFDKDTYKIISAMEGIDRGADGQPLASGELYVVINTERRAQDTANLCLRGVSSQGPSLRPSFRIVEGRMFQPGMHELISSRGVANRFQGCGLGETLMMRKTPYKVVGIFSDEGSPYESEVWGDADALGMTHGRNGYSSVLLRASDGAARARLKSAIEGDPRLALKVMDQKSYFEKQTETAIALQTLGVMMTIFLGIGACFSAANTMYASVLYRSREIGTLRALGFTRSSILLAYVIEAVVLAVLAGAVGVALGGLILSVYSGHIGTSNWVTFTEVVFRITLSVKVVLVAMLLSAGIGAIGGLMPALRAARMPIVDALRAA